MQKLPKRVARLYGGTLPKSILLKPPYGSECKIDMKGILDFNFQFVIHLLVRSIPTHSDESEVKGNPKVPNKEETKDDDDDDSVQILGSSSTCPNTAEESLPPISPPRKRMRTRASAQLLKRVRGDNYCLHLQSEAVGIKSQHP
ncbi:hypothetical protein TIFTF001_048020 [Ficus carica]|uniref:Uncharacterized protein n=1 Tax=Ficus carica TaxID=3494 RepID=A0AA88CUQ0_FICCA|nr:hypothetical protein TIFTF001_048020 [Ficus carica]